MITQQFFEQAYTYESYLGLVADLFQEGKTSGLTQSEELIYFTGLNIRRMNRLNKTVKIDADLAALINTIDRDQKWLVISEAWCGDAAQILPVIHKMAELNPHIELKIILRDDNPEVMDAYLTNGNRAIPKLIMFDAESMDNLFAWGPRPDFLQKLVIKTKGEGMSHDEINKNSQLWYTKDKTRTIQAEFVSLLKQQTIKHLG